MERLDDVIDVWTKFPDTKAFNWRNKPASHFYHIDFWLVSGSINIHNTLVDILPASLTGHEAIYI